MRGVTISDCFFREHSRSGFKINLRRKVSTFIFNYYIPSGLFVIVSWMSFVIPPDSVPARYKKLVLAVSPIW